jgi:hypothetical protein
MAATAPSFAGIAVLLAALTPVTVSAQSLARPPNFDITNIKGFNRSGDNALFAAGLSPLKYTNKLSGTATALVTKELQALGWRVVENNKF